MSALLTDLATLLRRVVFVGEAPLGLCFDFERVCLRAIRSGDQHDATFKITRCPQCGRF
jgi:hypothetical protein